MTPTVILTRPDAQSASFAADLRARWAGDLTIIQSPLIKIVPLPVQIAVPDAVVLSSANGASAAAGLGLPEGLPAWCVGTKTAQAAQRAGFAPLTGPGDAAGLVHQIIAAQPKGRFVHIRGQHARGDVASRLTDAGIICADVVAYDQQILRLSDAARAALAEQKEVIFPLFSPRTATILNDEGPFLASISVVALSDAVKAAVSRRISADIAVAANPSGAAMIDGTIACLRR